MKIKISLTKKQAIKQRQKCDTTEYKGLFIWIGSGNVVDKIVGYHKKRGFIADKCYNTGKHWIVDLFHSLFKWKDGFVRITCFI